MGGLMLNQRRNLDQNSLMWALIADIASQLKWPVDGVEQFLAKEDWKVILTAGVKREHRIAQGINGGFVILGTPTSRMTKAEFSELIDFIQWFGNERGIQWSKEATCSAA